MFNSGFQATSLNPPQNHLEQAQILFVSPNSFLLMSSELHDPDVELQVCEPGGTWTMGFNKGGLH